MIGLRQLSLLLLFCAATQAQTPRSTWDGVYTPVQSIRGEIAYTESCARCHRANLSGYGGVLMGAYFMESWRDEGLDQVFNLIKRSMPRNRPGSLTDQQYIDIIAYVLEFNHFPQGNKELTAGDLPQVLVAGPEGPNAILDFGTLVKVSGCLVESAKNEWTVFNGSPPVRTKDPEDSKGADLDEARTQQLGEQVFHLQDSSFFHPERSKDHRVEAKGFLTKQPNGGKLFLTSMQETGGPCSASDN